VANVRYPTKTSAFRNAEGGVPYVANVVVAR